METALAWIGKLYAVEKDLRERCQGEWQSLPLEQRAARITQERQQRSRPLLDGFHTWLESEAAKVLPKSAVRGAMDYTLSNWAALSVYPEDGWLDIDNNEGENSLRGLCIGRRNWLFVGSERGGRAAAIHFSLLASCKRHGHDPWVYLCDVLTRLPAMLPGTSEKENSRPTPSPLASILISPAHIPPPSAIFRRRVPPDAYKCSEIALTRPTTFTRLQTGSRAGVARLGSGCRAGRRDERMRRGFAQCPQHGVSIGSEDGGSYLSGRFQGPRPRESDEAPKRSLDDR